MKYIDADFYLSRGILNLWHDKTFDDFKGDVKIVDYLKEYIEKAKVEQQSEGLNFYGEYGAGKSLLMNITLKELLVHSTVLCVSYPMLVSNYTKNWRGEGVLDSIMSVGYLGIDDIGKGFQSTEVSKDLNIAALDYVLRYRVQQKKATFVTTNITPSNIKKEYGEGIASLFKEACTIIEVVNTDYRNKKLKRL